MNESIEWNKEINIDCNSRKNYKKRNNVKSIQFIYIFTWLHYTKFSYLYTKFHIYIQI